jgi:hypothetical protein
MMIGNAFPLPPLPAGEPYEGSYSSEDMRLYALDARRPILASAIKDIDELRAQIAKHESSTRRLLKIIAVVNEQAEDHGLWFNAVYTTEAYLQQALRRLHAVIERGGS